MAFTSVGAIYATQSNLLQRIYIPHADDSEIAQQFVGPGESIQNVSLAVYQSGGALAVQAAIGAPTFSGRCAVVDGANIVIDLIVADPAIYTDPRGLVIAHDRAGHGDTWDGTKFNRQFIEVDHVSAKVVNVSVQPILSPHPTANALNYLMGAVPGQAVPTIGTTIPEIQAKIAAKVV